MNPKFTDWLPILVRHDVRFIVIGGVAGIVHGLARATYDLDVLYRRTPDNIQNLVAALQPHSPYLRGAPKGLPFHFDERTVRAGLNFTLTTDLGDLDLLGEVAGGGTYDELLPLTQEADVYGARFTIVTLERLIQLKMAAGRPKDLEVIAELQALLEERSRPKPAADPPPNLW